MVEGGKTQGGTDVLDRDGDVTRAISNRPCNKLCGGMICTSVVELTHLFGVEEGRNVSKGVS